MGGWLWAGSSPAGVTEATGAKIISILTRPWVEKKNTGRFTQSRRAEGSVLLPNDKFYRSHSSAGLGKPPGV